MCELLALSSSRPAQLTFSLQRLASHGDMRGGSPDGWGVAFCSGHDVALFREPAPAASSSLVRYLEDHGPRTQLAISHIRHATRGPVNLANTQPFVRELGGRTHVFAHNGDLPGIWGSANLSLDAHHPVGETDSEQAFCALLARLRELWSGTGLPPLDERFSLVNAFAAELRTLGPANFLYTDGEVLFAHGHRRKTLPGGSVEAPGLWLLQRYCADTDTASNPVNAVSIGGGGQSVVMLASVPLTPDAWRSLNHGEIVVVRDGVVVTPGASATGVSTSQDCLRSG
ncbi:class II glutamine amidotransferase [Hydrogenophaga sp. H7]|uniref:class II glutamine amidotransferase n=1 Tax=Hydrogenophaga sp. H7 TaxID=1882399 RepID=UPI0009A261F3|nr:class II glutamine amidotransferase [Hydrogenophaga sp. H7]